MQIFTSVNKVFIKTNNNNLLKIRSQPEYHQEEN